MTYIRIVGPNWQIRPFPVIIGGAAGGSAVTAMGMQPTPMPVMPSLNAT